MNRRFEAFWSQKIREAAYGFLSATEVEEMVHYIWLYKTYHCDAHWEVNEIISSQDAWDEFQQIRSLNNHGYDFKIEGIEPKYFAIVCKALEIGAGSGNPLIDYEKY